MSRRNKKIQKPPVATKPTLQPKLTNGASSDWRDHPLAIATIAAVATFTLTTLAFKEIVIPTQIADLNNQIKSLPELQETIANFEKSNATHLAKIDVLKRQVEAFESKDLFIHGLPIPIILNKVTLNQPVSDVEKYFPQAKIDKSSEGLWSVEFGYGAFSQVVYFYDEKSKKKTITHIMYTLSSKNNYTNHFLHDRLVESLGEPTRNPKKDFFEWRIKRYSVFKNSDDKYIVLPSNSHPGYWPDE